MEILTFAALLNISLIAFCDSGSIGAYLQTMPEITPGYCKPNEWVDGNFSLSTDYISAHNKFVGYMCSKHKCPIITMTERRNNLLGKNWESLVLLDFRPAGLEFFAGGYGKAHRRSTAKRLAVFVAHSPRASLFGFNHLPVDVATEMDKVTKGENN